jgi:hypothetical protein
MDRKLAPEHVVIEISVEIGKNCAPRFDALDPAQRVTDGKMAWMWGVAKGVDDPDVECA